MKRKSRGAKSQKGSPFDGELKLIEPDAAAIDVGSRSHWVAVNPQRDREAVREFGAFTMDLMRLADWLAQCEVTPWSMPTRCVICRGAPKVTSKTVNGFVDCTAMGYCEAHFGRRHRSANCATTCARPPRSLKLPLNSSFECRRL